MATVQTMNTDSEDASALMPLPLPNFRRYLRPYPNASHTLKEDPVIRRFYLIMPPAFKEEVKLPWQFCHEMGINAPSDAILISYKGMWKINFGRCSCHIYLVLSGDRWRSFIRHHDLKRGDLIWFEQTDSMVFRVHAFDLDADGEKFSSGYAHSERTNVGMLDYVLNGCNYGRYNFTANIEEHHLKKAYMTIPADFVKRNDDLKEKTKVILVNTPGHAWEVELAHYHNRRLSTQRHMTMRHGWPAFRDSIKLQIGDVVTFSLDNCSRLSSPDCIVMSVRILRTI